MVNSSYWPFGAPNANGAFNNGSVSTNAIVPDSSGTFMRLPDDNGGADYIFGTPNGVFVVDTQNGAILGFAQASSKDFDPARIGTYKAIFYMKTGAHSGLNNSETGTPTLGKGTVSVTAGDGLTITDSFGAVLAAGTLTPIADTPYLYGANLLQDPCNGMFTVRLSTVGTQQDVFVTFLDHAVLFSSFKTALPASNSNDYDYFYGGALE